MEFKKILLTLSILENLKNDKLTLNNTPSEVSSMFSNLQNI